MKLKIRYLYVPPRMLKLKRWIISNFGMVGEQIELPISDKMLNDKVILKKKKVCNFSKS